MLCESLILYNTVDCRCSENSISFQYIAILREQYNSMIVNIVIIIIIVVLIIILQL